MAFTKDRATAMVLEKHTFIARDGSVSWGTQFEPLALFSNDCASKQFQGSVSRRWLCQNKKSKALPEGCDGDDDSPVAVRAYNTRHLDVRSRYKDCLDLTVRLPQEEFIPKSSNSGLSVGC